MILGHENKYNSRDGTTCPNGCVCAGSNQHPLALQTHDLTREVTATEIRHTMRKNKSSTMKAMIENRNACFRRTSDTRLKFATPLPNNAGRQRSTAGDEHTPHSFSLVYPALLFCSPWPPCTRPPYTPCAIFKGSGATTTIGADDVGGGLRKRRLGGGGAKEEGVGVEEGG